MSAHRVFSDMANALQAAVVVPDPGSAGTFDLDTKPYYQYCEVVTAGAEQRTVPLGTGQVGRIFDVFFKTDGGNLTITSAGSAVDSDGSASVVLTAVGDHATFKLIDQNGSKRWLLVSSSKTAS